MKMNLLDQTMFCILDGNQGIYIPKVFAESFEGWEIDKDDLEVLKSGPDHELYWDTWDHVLEHGYYMNEKGKWYLYQDGDLFAVHESHKWEEN
jgi:hypothetical protein